MSLCILDGRLWEVWVYRPCLFAAAPRFTVRELKLQQKLIAPPVGNSAKLDCSADGYPTPRVAWYKNGKPFNERRGSSLYLDWKYVLALKEVVRQILGHTAVMSVTIWVGLTIHTTLMCTVRCWYKRLNKFSLLRTGKVTSAKQRRYPCSEPSTNSTN